MSKSKKTPTQVTQERIKRWFRYGTLGQSKYGLAALDRIINDEAAPPSIRYDAESVKRQFINLMNNYKGYLNV